jgi:hypothetical protein
MATFDLSWPAQGTDHPTWRTSSSIPSDQLWRFRKSTCEFSWSAQGIDWSYQQDMFLPCKLTSSHLHILPVLLRLLVYDLYYVEFTAWAFLLYFQYYSIFWFTSSTTWSLLHGHRSQTSSTTLFTGSRQVLHGVWCMGIAPKLPVLLYLLVHHWYYMEFAEWASLPNFQ